MITPAEQTKLFLSGILRGIQICQEIALVSRTILDFKDKLKTAELVINSAKEEVKNDER